MEGPGRCFSADGVEVQPLQFLLFVMFIVGTFTVLLFLAVSDHVGLPIKIDPLLQDASLYIIFSIGLGVPFFALIAALKHIWTSI